MPNFEQEGQRPTEAEQPSQEQKVQDERYTKPVDVDLLYDYNEYRTDYFDWKSQNSTGLEQRGAEQRFDETVSIQSILTPYLSRQMNGQELIDTLNRQLDNLNDRLDRATEKDYDRIQKQIKGMEAAIQFVDQEIKHPTTREELERRKQELSAATVQKPAKAEVTSTQTEPARVEQSEKEKIEQELLDEIAREGGVAIHTSVPPEYVQDHTSGGFTTLMDSRIQADRNRIASEVVGVFSNDNGEYIQDQMKRAGVHEAVAMRPIKKQTQSVENVTVEKPGFFGTKKVIEQRTVTQSYEPKHGEMVQGGSQESAYALHYLACGGEEYRDYSNRSGQMLAAEIVLPKSVAEKVYAQIQRDPSFMQKIIDQAVIRQTGLEQGAWFNGSESTRNRPIRPPYEQWRQSGESKMLFSQEDETTMYSHRKLQTENVKSY